MAVSVPAAGHTFLEVFDDEVDANETDNFPAFIDGVDDVLGNSLGPFAVSRKATVLEALTAARVGPGDVVLDIGSGDGRFCVAAVQCCGASHAVGVELDPQLVTLATQLATRCGVAHRATFLAADFTSLASLSALLPHRDAADAAAAAAAVVAAARPCVASDASPSTSAGAAAAAAAGGACGTSGTPSSGEPASSSGSIAGAAGTSGVPPNPPASTSPENGCMGTSSSSVRVQACAGFTVAVVYLLPGSEERFGGHLTQLYDSGARIVAIHFPLSASLTIAARGANYYVYQRAAEGVL